MEEHYRYYTSMVLANKSYAYSPISGTHTKSLHDGYYGNLFRSECGTTQGDIASPTIFNILVNMQLFVNGTTNYNPKALMRLLEQFSMPMTATYIALMQKHYNELQT
jgi:hypothetical protein